ncbi:hypothetical protein QJS10_CPB17g02428 [Acorus calamus]|uniref:Major facilitator superfamily (MFS) profile domain-containing protein n=1 Tax=Acorus calamus TaxID=4465 RepID=A0AAV9CTM6_ACOCL|nr:hypothetical protein QJS10_CPB17g02428 [Acorus calamus]
MATLVLRSNPTSIIHRRFSHLKNPRLPLNTLSSLPCPSSPKRRGSGSIVRVSKPEDIVTDDLDKEIPVSVAEEVNDGLDLQWPPWKDLPHRYKVIGATSLAFVVCNMDKVNLSIAIIPMSHQFGWNSSTAGLVQSSFFWGYALSQLPGGWLAKFFGGRKVLEVGVFIWSLATMLVPLVGGFIPGLVLSRILVGIGEGVSPSAATDLIARTIPLQERSRAVAFVFGGLSVGSILGLLLAPSLIQNLGWESVFYLFGFLGILWCVGFEFVKDGQSSFMNENGLNKMLQSVYTNSPFTSTPGGRSLKSLSDGLGKSLQDVPWKAFSRSPAVWAMVYAHFCGSWGHYTCLSWLPTYFSEELDLNLTEAAWVSILPSLGSIVVTSIAAPFADNLISSGVEITRVRKICQTIAFLSPAVCMTLSSVDLGLPPWEVVAFLTSGLALSSFALSGLYCTHQDISPEYASILLGITNTVGAFPGIIGVALTGYLLDTTHSWSISLFAPSIFFYLTGTIVWLVFASSKPQNFSETD